MLQGSWQVRSHFLPCCTFSLPSPPQACSERLEVTFSCPLRKTSVSFFSDFFFSPSTTTKLCPSEQIDTNTITEEYFVYYRSIDVVFFFVVCRCCFCCFFLKWNDRSGMWNAGRGSRAEPLPPPILRWEQEDVTVLAGLWCHVTVFASVCLHCRQAFCVFSPVAPVCLSAIQSENNSNHINKQRNDHFGGFWCCFFFLSTWNVTSDTHKTLSWAFFSSSSFLFSDNFGAF